MPSCYQLESKIPEGRLRGKCFSVNGGAAAVNGERSAAGDPAAGDPAAGDPAAPVRPPGYPDVTDAKKPATFRGGLAGAESLDQAAGTDESFGGWFLI